MKTVLVVGAGFSGVALARELVENDPDIFVEIIEERPHIGGNAYDYDNEKGIRVHKYGPHLFHTNNKRVWDWVNRFGEWVEYKHKVKAILEDGTYVTLPVVVLHFLLLWSMQAKLLFHQQLPALQHSEQI